MRVRAYSRYNNFRAAYNTHLPACSRSSRGRTAGAEKKSNMTSPFESSGNVLEDFLDALQDLPVDTQRGLELIRELARIEDHYCCFSLCPHKKTTAAMDRRDGHYI